MILSHARLPVPTLPLSQQKIEALFLHQYYNSLTKVPQATFAKNYKDSPPFCEKAGYLQNEYMLGYIF